MPTRRDLDRYKRSLEQTETELKEKSPNTALLLADCFKYATQSKPLPLRHSGNPLRNAMTAIRPQAGSNTHALGNTVRGMGHEKRKYAVAALSTGASIGTGFGVSAAVGGGATAALGIGGIAVLGAVTGGIAVGVLLLGIGIGAGIAAYQASEKADKRKALKTGGDDPENYSSATAMSDIRYLLTHGELQDLARFHEKACETEQELETKMLAPVRSCVDAANLAYAMYRHKRRLEDRLANSDRMDHLAEYKTLVDMKISDAALLLEHMGRLHTINTLSWLAFSNTSNKAAYGYSKGGAAAAELKDYVDLKWKTWYDDALANRSPARAHGELRTAQGRLAPKLLRRASTLRGGDAELMKAFASILHEAKHSSDGDHKDVAGTVTRSLTEALLTGETQAVVSGTGGVSTSSSTSRSEAAGAFTSSKVLDLFLGAGKSAATTAATSSALGAGAVGSVGNIAASGGVGVAVGIIVSALFTYVFDAINDSMNRKAILSGSITNKAQRIWVLRSMLENGRVNTLYESYKKTQESIVRLTGIYRRYDFDTRFPSHAEMVEMTKLMFRIQKHLLRMLAMDGVLTMFFNELDEHTNEMLAHYSNEIGLAECSIHKVKTFVESYHHACAGTCYELTGQGNNGITVPFRLGS